MKKWRVEFTKHFESGILKGLHAKQCLSFPTRAGAVAYAAMLRDKTRPHQDVITHTEWHAADVRIVAVEGT